MGTPRSSKQSSEYFMKLSQSDNLSKQKAMHKRNATQDQEQAKSLTQKLEQEVEKIEEEA